MVFGIIGSTGRFGKIYQKTLTELGFQWAAIDPRKGNDWLCSVDVVCIVSPPDTHFKYAAVALEAGKHVILEKPACSTTQECLDLKRLAENNGVTCQVNYSYLWHPEFAKIKESSLDLRANSLHFDSRGGNSGPLRDFSCIWDWANHCLSLIFSLAPSCGDLRVKHFNFNSEDRKNGNFCFDLEWCNQVHTARVCGGNNYSERFRSFYVANSSKIYGFDVDFGLHLLPIMIYEFKNRIDKGDIWHNMDLAAQVTNVLEKICPLYHEK